MLKYFCKNYYAICSFTQRYFFYESLKSRSLVEVIGNDCRSFLQGLITNDINGIGNSHNSIYSLFLNSKGRVLYDVIIYGNSHKSHNDNQFYFECDGRVVDSVIRHLCIYRLRKKIEIRHIEGAAIYVITPENQSESLESLKSPLIKNENLVYYGSDPRIKSWLLRCVGLDQSVEPIMSGMKQAPDNNYLEKRLIAGVCEGADEFLVGKKLPLEFNGDIMNGINFNKGCYIGQELTARTYHTGVVRKRVMPVRFDRSYYDKLRTAADNGLVDFVDESGGHIGQLISFDACGRGLATVRLSSLVPSHDQLKANESDGRVFRSFKIENSEIEMIVHAPNWWPHDVLLPV